MGESEELSRVYDAYAPRLYPYVLSIVRHRADAEDALQNLFVKLARRGLKGIQDMDAYLFSSARHEALRLRRRPEIPLAEIVIAPQESFTPALDALPPEQAEVVFLKVLEGLTFKQIGETLGIPQDTAASRYRYAMEKLRDGSVRI